MKVISINFREEQIRAIDKAVKLEKARSRCDFVRIILDMYIKDVINLYQKFELIDIEEKPIN